MDSNTTLKGYSRVMQDINRRRDRILSGKINCIPCPFKRYSAEWPGIEKGKYYGVTGQQKSGKTQVADYMFVYHPLMYAMQNKDKIRLKIFYFSLEMNYLDKYKQFMCHLLYILSNGSISIDQRVLNSVVEGKSIPNQILSILGSDKYKEYFEFFEECIEIIEDVRHPTGIFYRVKEYMEANGKWVKKKVETTGPLGEIDVKYVNDHYVPDDPDLYVIPVIDHISLITPEKESGKDIGLHASISKLSATYMLDLRDKYGCSPVIIQQQALAGESTDNVKLGRLKPTVSDLAENKLTSRD